ncbi:MAG TPA: ABC transporter substrate-binding protein [Candidatus Methylomirabilis sp.]|nr:ABC transporter substrate-binding protein [Candidatus Methylomirabilis sp.]
MKRFQGLPAVLLALLAVLSMGLAIYAPVGSADAATFPTENVSIEIWWHEYGPFTAYVKELIEAYKKARPNITINPTVASSTDMNQKLTVALAAGTGPDIMDADASYYVAYHAKGVLEPVDLDVFGVKTYQELMARYVSGGLASGTFDGKVYTLPYQGNSMSLFINNKLFASAGLNPQKDAPKTWTDLMAVCPKLKKVEGRRTVRKAFEFPYHSPRWQLQDLQPMTEQFGGKILSDDGKTAYLNSPETVKALTLWRDVTKQCGDPKTTKNTASDPNQDFLDGFTAMWITGPWATPQVRKSDIKDDFTVVGLPQVDPAKPRTMVYGWAWGVNRNKPEKNKIVAWDFIKFMLSKPEEWLAKAGFVQPVKGVANTDVAKKFPFFDVHMKDVATASWYIRSENVNEIAQAVGRAVDSVVYDGADPKTGLDAAQASVEKVLKK